MRWPITRNRGGTWTSGAASAQAVGTEVRLLPTNGLEAFSDAVFAIAITLLRGLEHEWPRYLATS